MKYFILCCLIFCFIFCSCSDKTYTDNLKQSEWIELYDNITLSETVDSVKKKFPAISNWATEEKDNKVYLWTAQRMFDTDAHAAFIFSKDTLFQVKIYLKNLSKGDAKDVFDNLKSKYTASIKTNKHFCNNENSDTESCIWLMEGMTVYLKYVEYENPLILFGFQKR